MKRNLILLFTVGVAVAFLYPRIFSTHESFSNRTPSSLPEVIPLGNLSEESAQSTTLYHYERIIKADLKDVTEKTLLDFKLNGTVFVTELAHTSLTQTVLMQFSLRQGNDPTLHESKIPFLVELNHDQSILSLKAGSAPTKMDEDDLNVLKDFATLYAYGSNRDTTGVYQFDIKRSGNQIEKSKLKYQGISQQINFTSSKTVAQVEPVSGVWVSGSGKDETRMAAEGSGSSSLRTTYSYKIEKITDASIRRPRLKTLAGISEASLELKAQSGASLQTWEQLKAKLAIIKTLSKTQRLTLFHGLAKLLKSDPKAVLDFRKYIQSKANEEGLMTFGIGVLATAGSDEAQSVLRDWYKGDSSGVEQHTILNAFATANTPLSPETKAFLNSVVSSKASDPELAQNAILALGSSLRQDGDPSTRQTLSQYYANSKTESDRLIALDGIGNSGDSGFLSALTQAVNSGTPAEQARAVMASRFLPATQAAPILLAAYESGNLAMQKASLQALSSQQNLVPNATLIQKCAQAGESICITLSGQLAQ